MKDRERGKENEKKVEENEVRGTGEMDGRGSVPGRDKNFLFSSASDRLWGPSPASYPVVTGGKAAGM